MIDNQTRFGDCHQKDNQKDNADVPGVLLVEDDKPK